MKLTMTAFAFPSLFGISMLMVACSDGADEIVGGTGYRVETLVAGGPMYGAKGMTFGPDGMLYVGSVFSQSIYRIDVATGKVTTAVGAPDGEADDVAFSPDGTMVWTAMPSGEIRALQKDGSIVVLASGLPLINPIDFTTDGRLFAGQIGFDRLYELDVTGETPPRLVAEGIGNLNSFEITDDNELYGPLSGKGTVARIDIETGEVSPIVQGHEMFSAVNLDSKGLIYAVEWAGGRLWRIDPESGDAEVVTRLEPPLDNLAIGSDDSIYVTQPARSAVVRIDPASGEKSDLVPGNFSMPGGLTVVTHEGKEALVVADDLGFRMVDIETGRVWTTIDLAKFIDPYSATNVAANDNVMVFTDVARSRVYSFDRQDNSINHKWAGLDGPYGVVVLGNGDPLVAEFRIGKVVRLSQANEQSREVVADGLGGPVGMVLLDGQTLYVTEALSGSISRIDLATSAKTLVVEDLQQPEGITVLSDGRLAVVEVGKHRVITVDPATGDVAELATNLPIGRTVPNTPAPVHAPSGITAGDGDVLYLTSDQDQSVLKLIPPGFSPEEKRPIN